AYRDAVVAGVAHHLVLDLLPSLETLLDQYLGDAAGESAPQGRFDLRLEPHDAAALPAERVPAAQDDRPPDLPGRRPRRGGGIGKPLSRLDRRDVRVDQNGSDAFLAQRLDRLGTGIVKLARLSDLQRARTEHHRPARLSRQINAVHGQRCATEATRRRKSSNRNPVSCGPGLASGWNWTLKCG